MSAGRVGRADDRPEIVRVLDAVRNDEEGRLLPRTCEQFLHLAVGTGRGKGGDSLVVDSGTEGVELLAGGVLHRDSRLLGHCDDPAEAAAALLLSDNQNFIDRPPASEQFDDRVAPCNNLILLPGVRRGAVFGASLLLHLFLPSGGTPPYLARAQFLTKGRGKPY